MIYFVLSDYMGVLYADRGECGGKEPQALKAGCSASGMPVAVVAEKGCGNRNLKKSENFQNRVLTEMYRGG